MFFGLPTPSVRLSSAGVFSCMFGYVQLCSAMFGYVQLCSMVHVYLPKGMKTGLDEAGFNPGWFMISVRTRANMIHVPERE